MKRLLISAVLFLYCIATTFAQFTGTVTDEQGVKYTANEDESTCIVSGHESNYSATIDIPKTYEGRTVTSIGSYAFYGCSGLTSITIPNSVTSIGFEAFSYTAWLDNQSDGVVYAGKVAYCYKGEMPANTSIVLDEGTLGIGVFAFVYCSGLTSITIPNSMTSIGEGAFYDSGLTSITIPNSVTSIGGSAFSGCSGLTSVTIPNSVTSIGDGAFSDCSGLTSITIPNSVTSIGNYTFSGCSSLTSVTIPKSVTSIGGSAFSGCSGLTSIVVEAGNTVYDSREGCNAIIKTDDNDLIAGCKNTVIPNGVTSIGSSAFSGCSGLTSITIPHSVTSIGSSAFEDCSGLTSINIPNSVTSIGGSAFKNCSGLTSVTVQRGTPVAINNYVFSNRTNANLYVPTGCVAAYQAADYWKEFNKIEEILTGTMTDEQGVKYTANADDITCTVSGYEEGYDASIIIPKVFQGRTVSSISDNAFKGCSNLTSVNIPNSVTSIGNNAFDGCVNLTNVGVCIDSPIEIDNSVFSNKANATLYVPANSVAAYQTADNWKDFSVIEAFFTGTMTDDQGVRYTSNYDGTCTVSGHGWNYNASIAIPKMFRGNSVTSIGSDAFLDCRSLTSITIPNSVTSIGYDAFEYCSGLTSITIPNSVTSIGEEVFWGCSSLTSITIPNSVTSIGEEAFRGCSSLTSIVVEAGNAVYDSREGCNAIIKTRDNELIAGCKNTIIPSSVTSIGHRAFYRCSGLTSITIPNSVTSIGGFVFSDCGSLTSIVVEAGNTVYDSREDCNAIIKTSDNELIAGCKNTIIPNSVTSIGEYALYFCSGLTSITIPNSVTSIGRDAFRDCSGLTSVTVQRGTPVAIDNYVFSNRTNANLYVPTGCVAAYQAADYWKEFNKIEEILTGTMTDEQGVKYTANADDITCTVSGYEEGYDASIIIPKVFQGRTVSSISDNAFKGCSDLTSVNIPNSVTSIGNNAFDGCVNLTNVGVCIDSPIKIDNGVFSNRANATLYVPANSVTAYQTADNWKDFNVIEAILTGTMTDEQGVRYTSNYDGTCTVSGYDDNYNASIAIPKMFRGKSVTSIGRAAFEGCSLISITIPNSVTSIGDFAFNLCSSLTSITIPNSVTSIGWRAFSICSGLTSITIPHSVTSIGSSAFEDCSGLTSVTVQRGTPVAIDVDVFTNRANAMLYVPVGSKALYEAADYWKEFKEIVEVEGMMDASILDNALYADDVTVYPDGATCFPILMKSEESITNVQFDVVLPEGVTIKNSTLTDRKGSDHTITTSSVNGATRFIVTSMGGQVFSDNDGAVINLSLDIDKNLAPGHRGITLRNVTLSTTGAVKVNTPACTAILSVSDIESGDADGDGVTDVNDVTSTINHILKKPVASFVRGAADVDGDSVIDVNDVQATIDKALGKTASSRGTDRQEETEPALDPQ